MRSRVIIYSGWWNIGLSGMLSFPPLYRGLGLNLLQKGWGWLIAGFLLYTAATLILGGRDIIKFGGIILYEGLLRFLAAALLIPAGIHYGYGWLAVAAGITDALWASAYFVIVPKRTRISVRHLLAGRGIEAAGRDPRLRTWVGLG
jgi:hypothetical protein